jgi:CBS domain containing-hemolysin-like protein
MESFLIAFAILIAYYCTFLSAALSSLTQETLIEILKSGSKNSKKLHNLKLHYEESKAAIFIIEAFLLTISFIFIGIELYRYGYQIYTIILFILIIFILVIIIRSIIWALGSRFSDKIALKMVNIISFFYLMSLPLYKITERIIEILSGKGQDEASREELSAMFETAHEEGSIEADEYRILKNIMHFSNVLVSDVMTPRTVIFSCHADSTVAEIVKLPELQMYSRFPIWEGESIDDGIIGYVMSKDILHAALTGESDKKLREFSRPVYIIPENAELDKALEKFLQRRQHLTIVVDEYGGVEGILTMEDVVETILGVEIVDEADRIVDLREAAKHQRDQRVESLKSSRGK